MDKIVIDLKVRFVIRWRYFFFFLKNGIKVQLLFVISNSSSFLDRKESLRVIVNSQCECVSRDFSFAQQTSRRICNRIGLLEIDKFGPSLDRYLWNIVICKFAPLNATESLINPDSYITIELIELLSYLRSKFQKRVICLMFEFL